MNYSIALTLCLTPFKDLIFISTRHRITNHSILYISTTFFGIEKQPFSMPHLTQSLSHLHRRLRDAQIILSHDAIDISFFVLSFYFFFCWFVVFVVSIKFSPASANIFYSQQNTISK